MNKITTLILLTLLSSCYVEDILEQDIYVVHDNTCVCVFYSEHDDSFHKTKLKPGTDINDVGSAVKHKHDGCPSKSRSIRIRRALKLAKYESTKLKHGQREQLQ